jgi:hypothetical protein
VIWLFWTWNSYCGACSFCFWTVDGSHSKLLVLWPRLTAWFQTAVSLKWVCLKEL